MKTRECDFCAKQFKLTRRDKRFCSDICRWRAWNEAKEIEIPCHYCGVPADTTDHVPPRAYRDAAKKLGYALVEVDACRECNTALGARRLWTLPERKRFIKKWLAKKYARYLKDSPKWDDNEIDELNGWLKDYFRAGIVIGEITRRRLKW